ncbi:MAG: sodium-dependent bicarbonate transport family permease [Actinomycetota bacterium]
MSFVVDVLQQMGSQFRSPTLGFLIGGMLVAALGSKLRIPDAVYQFIVFMLLMRIGLSGGIEIREADVGAMLLPALWSVIVGVTIVLVGSTVFSFIPSIRREDGIATAGLFGAVSASTLAAAIVLLEEESITFEAWVPALYPFMDIPALILAIVLANVHAARGTEGETQRPDVVGVVRDSLRSSAISALILGLALGLLTEPDPVLESFYDPLFRGFLSVLLLVMGMEAWSRLGELRRVAHWYAVYAFVAPILHGLLAFGLGAIAHVVTGFSPGGVILLSVIAASNSDISGPPTLRAAIPSANPSAYIGASTSVGTPVSIAICIPLFIALAELAFDV